MYRVNALRFTYPKYKNFQDKKDIKIAISELNERLQERYDISLPEQLIVSQIVQGGMNIAAFYDVVMSHLYLKNGILHWAEKCQLMWREIDLFLSLYPNGKAIHIIRDPRSVLASFKHYTKYPYPACLSAIFNCYDSMKYALSQKTNTKVCVVKYEDILDDRDNHINLVWDFLGLSTGHEINLNEAKDAYGQLWYSNSSFLMNNKDNIFDVQRAKFGWKDVLNDDEILLTEYICGDLMQQFNYELYSKLPTNESMELFVKSLDDKTIEYFEGWKKGFGIQQFPANPVKKETWEKI
jgi:hypothetical protein